MFFPIPNSRYSEGIEVDEYNGLYSLVLAQKADDGTVYKRWCFPQVKDKKPGNKALPWKITIGESVKEAIEMLENIAIALSEQKPGQPDFGVHDQTGAEDSIPF